MKKYHLWVLSLLTVLAVNCAADAVQINNCKCETFQLPGNVKLEMVKLPAGDFKRGNGLKEIFPEQAKVLTCENVTISRDFYLGKYEVTQAQYKAVMGVNPSDPVDPDFPVNCVSHYDAMAFCQKLNEFFRGKLPDGYEFALPTEAQWEYACWAGEKSIDLSQLGEYGWYCGSAKHGDLSKVGQKKPNAWGLYDMLGNVYEDCSDWYGAYFENTDPQGPAHGLEKVCRGGSFLVYAENCHPAVRHSGDPAWKTWDGGFRVALVKKPLKSGDPDTLIIELDNGAVLEMVRIPAGSFFMGSPQDEFGRRDNEDYNVVTIHHDFWMSKYEVTQEVFEAVLGDNPSKFKGKKRPVDSVSISDINQFMLMLNKWHRKNVPGGYAFVLPPEKHWEYACRGGSHRAFCNSKDLLPLDTAMLKEVGWFEADSKGQTSAVGQKKPNAWGLYDMHGNVREWCNAGSHSNKYPSGSKNEMNVSVARGGSWCDQARDCRSASRAVQAVVTGSPQPGEYNQGYDHTGFRVALVLYDIWDDVEDYDVRAD